jgi:hypothetical protein
MNGETFAGPAGPAGPIVCIPSVLRLTSANAIRSFYCKNEKVSTIDLIDAMDLVTEVS